MSQVITQVRGTLDTALSTELNSLANNALAAKSSALTLSTAGYLMGEVELSITFGTSPTASTGISVWFLREVDGSDYESGSSSLTPARAPDVVLPVIATTSAQRVIVPCVIPPGTFIPLAKNDGTGQAFPSSGTTIKIRPVSPQVG
jgi:hypothetical protein